MAGLGLNTASEQRDLTLIPDGTIVEVQMNIRPGNVGEDGMLKRSSSGQSAHLDCEFKVASEGEYHGRKFWANFTMMGESQGHADAANISRQTLRAILESALGINPKDMSEAAVKARDNATFLDFQGISFMLQVGVKEGDARPGGGKYADKNIIRRVITPDQIEWKPVVQTPRDHPPTGATSPSVAVTPAPISRPDWAKKQ
jgi:hypothetical protein